MIPEIKSNNNLTSAELYSIVGMVITNGRNNIGILNNYKDKYVAAFFDALELKLSAAKDNETEDEVTIDHVIDRIGVVDLGLTCSGNFPKLKGYIRDGFPANQLSALNIAAGQHHYAGSMNHNWQSVSSLNTAMIHFTTDPLKLAALLLDNNMKVPFPGKILSDSNAFETGHTAFLDARQTGVKTNERISADNDLYTETINVCEDAHNSTEVAEILKQFVIDTLKDIVSPPGSASYKVDCRLALEFTQIEGLTVKIQAQEQPAITLVTGPSGIVLFENIDPAKYSVTISGPGIISRTYKKDVNTGTNARNIVIMQPVPPII